MTTLYLYDEDSDRLLTEDGNYYIILEDGNVDAASVTIRMAQDHVRVVDSADPLVQSVKSASGEGGTTEM